MKVTINGHEVDVRAGDSITASLCETWDGYNNHVHVHRKVKDKNGKVTERKVIDVADW